MSEIIEQKPYDTEAIIDNLKRASTLLDNQIMLIKNAQKIALEELLAKAKKKAFREDENPDWKSNSAVFQYFIDMRDLEAIIVDLTKTSS